MPSILYMTRSEFMIDAVLAMNKAGDIDPETRVDVAKNQLQQLINLSVEFDEDEEEIEETKLLNYDPYVSATVKGCK